jgi:Zn ribbon nucleic-acid-binding protein
VWSYPTAERPDGADLEVVSGAQGLLDLSRLHARALSMLGLTRPIWKLPGMCPDCKEQDVLRREVQGPNADTVWCEQCGEKRPYGDYERYMRQLLWEGVS